MSQVPSENNLKRKIANLRNTNGRTPSEISTALTLAAKLENKLRNAPEKKAVKPPVLDPTVHLYKTLSDLNGEKHFYIHIPNLRDNELPEDYIIYAFLYPKTYIFKFPKGTKLPLEETRENKLEEFSENKVLLSFVFGKDIPKTEQRKRKIINLYNY